MPLLLTDLDSEETAIYHSLLSIPKQICMENKPKWLETHKHKTADAFLYRHALNP